MNGIGILRTTLFFALLIAIFLGIGFLIGGISGMTIALFLALAVNFLAYWYSDKIVLSMYGAREVRKEENPKLHEIVEKLSRKAEIPKPRVYLIDSPSPNAFATGRSPRHSAVAVTRGLLELLDEEELEGVLSHELAHIKSRDTLISTVAASVGGAISYLAQLAWYFMVFSEEREGGYGFFLLPLLIFAPLAATLVQLAISREREFEADRVGGIISKKPLGLASALRKIAEGVRMVPLERGNFATSHLFIVNPFRGEWISRLFSTHPPIEERIKRLEKLAEEIRGG